MDFWIGLKKLLDGLDQVANPIQSSLIISLSYLVNSRLFIVDLSIRSTPDQHTAVSSEYSAADLQKEC